MNDAQKDLYAVRQVLVGQRDKRVLDQCRAILDALAPRAAERERAARVEAWDEGFRTGWDGRDDVLVNIRNPYAIERGDR